MATITYSIALQPTDHGLTAVALIVNRYSDRGAFRGSALERRSTVPTHAAQARVALYVAEALQWHTQGGPPTDVVDGPPPE